MKIYILEKVLEYENKETNIDNIFNDINDIISESNRVLSHMEIDEKLIYDNFKIYISDNIHNIKKINVILKTYKDLIQDVILTTTEYLNNVNPKIKLLSDEFYKEASKETWEKLADLFEGINWIVNTFKAIDANYEINNYVKSYEVWNLYSKDIYTLSELLIDFEDIIESKDMVSIADIISYELSPIFENMEEKLNQLVDREVN